MLKKIAAILIGSLLPLVCSAQIQLDENFRPETLPRAMGQTSNEQIYGFVGKIILTAIQYAGALAILFIVLAGFRYVMSRGDEGEVGNAKSTLIWSVAALLILILSYSIVSTVFNLAASFGK